MLKTSSGEIVGTQMIDDRDVLYTRKQAAEYLDKSESTLERWSAEGVLVPLKIGPRHRRYSLRQLRQFTSSGTE
jgi:excisionase family DNA binding protein